MLKRVTKKHIEELTNIIINKGYWCEEVKEYLSKFEYAAMQRLDEKVKANVRNIQQAEEIKTVEPTLEEYAEELTSIEDVKESKVKHFKSYKFSNKDIIVIHNLINDIIDNSTTFRSAMIKLKSYCKNENKLEIFADVLEYYTNINNFRLGSRVNFGNGTKVYYNINDRVEALNKALQDDFISNKENITIIPYYPLDFYESKKLINEYLISLNQKVA